MSLSPPIPIFTSKLSFIVLFYYFPFLLIKILKQKRGVVFFLSAYFFLFLNPAGGPNPLVLFSTMYNLT